MRQLLAGPLFHGAPHSAAFNGLYCGNTLVMPASLDAETIVRCIKKYEIEYVQMVPTLMQRIIRMPGFNKDDIKIDIENDCLTISAERKLETNDEDKKKNFVKRERFYGSYSRSFDVTGIDVDHIEASYTDGVLTLNMPKKKEEIPASRRLEIK